MTDFGFLIGMTLQDAETAEGFLARCPLIAQSTSFGGVHTSGERRARWGDAVPAGFVRLSVGIEPVEVLWAAIEAALQA
jgi:cystathionine gamma-lyase